MLLGPWATRGASPWGKVSLHACRSRRGMLAQGTKSWGDVLVWKASVGTLVRPVLSQSTRGSECLASSRLWASVKTALFSHQNLHGVGA